MAEKLWKQTQRRIANQFGGTVTARSGYKGGDVETDWLVIEVKYRKRAPGWIGQAVDRARSGAGTAKLGIALIHGLGDRDDLIILRASDFKEWFGKLNKGDG